MTISELLQKIPFQDASLLLGALTHRSYLQEHPNSVECNERLEFLGDALLTFLSGEYLYRRFPEKREGDLTPLRSQLVDKPQLAKFANSLDIGKWMRLGKGAEKDGGRLQPRLLCNTFEAVVGAYFLDSGIEAVRDFIEPLFEEAIREKSSTNHSFKSDSNNHIDIKNRFQDWAFRSIQINPQRQPPEYIIIAESGPPNAKNYTAEVRVNSISYGIGYGRSKKEAEKAAAVDALAKVEGKKLGC
jgi:ribonuclease-3